jgi:hypothetical protein
MKKLENMSFFFKKKQQQMNPDDFPKPRLIKLPNHP